MSVVATANFPELSLAVCSIFALTESGPRNSDTQLYHVTSYGTQKAQDVFFSLANLFIWCLRCPWCCCWWLLSFPVWTTPRKLKTHSEGHIKWDCNDTKHAYYCILNQPSDWDCRNFVNKHQLSIQMPNVQRRACNVYVFRLRFHFAYRHWWLGITTCKNFL